MAIKARDAIVSVAAIFGSQVTGALYLGAHPAQSSSCIQWASESISAAQQNINYAVNPPPVSEDGYYDVRTHRDEPVQQLPQSQAAAAVPSAEMSMIPDMTQEDYQRARHAWTPGYAHE